MKMANTMDNGNPDASIVPIVSPEHQVFNQSFGKEDAFKSSLILTFDFK